MRVGIRIPISGRCVRVLNVLLFDIKVGMSILSLHRKVTEI